MGDLMPDTSIRGQFLWHELMTSDPEAAVAFYSRIIGWKKMKWEQDPSYTVFAYGEAPMAGVMKTPPEAKAMGTPPSWIAYVGTPDIHVTAWEAQRLGGKLHKGPKTTPTVGTWAILQDPQGAAFAAYTPERTPQVGQEPGLGDFSWHELATTDHKAAFAFYQELFGWEKQDSMDMGPAGEYLMYGLGKKMLGGMYTKTKDMPGPSAWCSYIRVEDAQATTKKLQAAGAKVMNGPMEVPGGDWITQAMDPQGAVFAIHAKAKKAAAKPRATKRPAGKKKAARPAKKAARKTTAKARTSKTAKRTKSAKAKRRK
jgi:predicted enzyme related to lactoylglutathione lyase